FVPIVRIAVACGFVITIILGGWYTLQGVLAIGSYSVLVSMTQRLLWPFIYLAKIADTYKRTMVSVERIFTIVDTPITIVDGHHEIPIEEIQGNIEFKNVVFGYPESGDIFNNLSVLIKQGQTV